MVVVRSCTLTISDATVTTTRTDDLRTGLFVYGANLPVLPKIASITNDTAFELDTLALATGTATLEFTTVTIGVFQERNDALIDARFQIYERGDDIEVKFRSEANVVRDNYSSIKQRDMVPAGKDYYWKAFPIAHNPDVKILRAAGLRDDHDIVATLAYKDFKDNAINLHEIDKIRTTVIWDGCEYEIKEIGRINHYADVFLNVTLGLHKR